MSTMQCAYAILLFTAGQAPTMDRLVITSFGADAHYGVYAPLPTGHFPVPYDASGIYTTRSEVKGPGTYNKYYCTEDLNSATLVQRLVAGLTPLPASNHYFFGTSPEELEACEEAIPEPEDPDAAPPAMSQVMQTPACTARVLAGLARAGRLSIIGPHDAFAPPASAAPRTIHADTPVPMVDLIDANHAFRRWGANRIRAFAWYQGHLQLFAKCPDQDVWYLYQGIGNETRGADHISKFVREINFDYGYSSKLLRVGEDPHQPGEANETSIHYKETNTLWDALRPSSLWGVVGRWEDCDIKDTDYYFS
ncbi:BgTH12-07447 [Blumeria graminis f. sp. triticale]|uniref:BgTH12-07447 n=1 Tax=Blumeria graminis f. sp. triticale TaxID=1689686 RepID=A0A9W4D1L6_BLUGR|nr:BgTH12-07447 [Blumeria graminis f. sp. triticale]